MERTGILSLTWNNHSSALIHSLVKLRCKDNFCDATIVCEDKQIPVHKIVLSSCSEYFEDIFSKTPCRHPFIILKDVSLVDFEYLLDYMYKGKVNILRERLSHLIKVSDSLKIKGLSVYEETNSPVRLSPQNWSPVTVSPNIRYPKVVLSNINKPSTSGIQQRTATALSPLNEFEDVTQSAYFKEEGSEYDFPQLKTGDPPRISSSSKRASKPKRKRSFASARTSSTSRRKDDIDLTSCNESDLSFYGDPIVVLERNLSLSEDNISILEENARRLSNEAKKEVEVLSAETDFRVVNDGNQRASPDGGTGDAQLNAAKKRAKPLVHEDMERDSLWGDEESEVEERFQEDDLESDDDQGNEMKENQEPGSHQGKKNGGAESALAFSERKDPKKRKKIAHISTSMKPVAESNIASNQSCHEKGGPEKCSKNGDDVPMSEMIPDLDISGASNQTSEANKCLNKSKTNIKKILKCAVCGFSTRTRPAFVAHLKTHKSIKTTFKCTVCSYKTISKMGLVRHNMTHSWERPFKCSHCPYRAKREVDLVKHRKIYCKVKTKVLECETCSFQTGVQSALTEHMESHLNKQFVCAFCSYKTVRKSLLAEHVEASHG